MTPGAKGDAVKPPSAHDPGCLLLITTSLDLTEHVVDVAGPLGIAVHIAPDLSAARRWLDRSRLVLIGADQLDTVTPAVFGPDRQVFVITEGCDPYAIALAERMLGSVVVFWLPAAAAWMAGLIGHAGIGAAIKQP